MLWRAGHFAAGFCGLRFVKEISEIQVIIMHFNKVEAFLKRHNMAASGIPLLRCTGEFLRAMRDGLAGHPSSLMMIPTYLSGGRQVPREQAVIVMDAGGTNFRIAAVHFDDLGSPVVEGFQKFPMPGTQGEITCDAFFDALAGFILEYADVSERVGFCFSFPTEILPNRDGRILAFSKEVSIPDAGGRLIGEGINAALAARGAAPKQFIVLNDTVATMLCGIGYENREYAGTIGFILGTGTNTCYLENMAEIPKIGGGTGTMAVNLESGCYSGFPRGDYDSELDAASQNPGDHLTEKMISGAYLGELITRTVRGAVREGLFSERLTAAYDMERVYNMIEISDFVEGKGVLAQLFAAPDDHAVLFALVEDCFDRAARITAVNFAAILTQTGRGHDPAHPVCIVAEGTTFYKAPLFRPKLEQYLDTFLRGELGFYCEIVKADDATLIGSAVAALINT